MHAKTQKTGDTLLHLAVSSTSTLHSNSFLDGDPDSSSASLCVFPSLEVTDFILKCGYDVHSRNNLRETPLHIGEISITVLLIVFRRPPKKKCRPCTTTGSKSGLEISWESKFSNG